MQRTTHFDKASIRNNNYKFIGIWLAIVAFVIFLGFMFLSPQGNTLMHKTFPTWDTPMDKVVKGKINERLDKDTTISSEGRTQFKTMINSVPLAQISNAAEDANTAATLYAQYYNQQKSTARAIIDVVYSDNKLNNLRQDIAGSHWVAAADDYNDLLKKGNVVSSIFKHAKKAANNSAKKMQDEGSKAYNDSFQNGQ